MTEIDKYFENYTSAQKAEYDKFRKLVLEIAPEAEEVISYGIPTFKYKKKPLIYFGAFKGHMSIFPASDEMTKAVGEDLAKFRTGKGTLQFTSAKSIPEDMLKKIIEFRLASLN